jgi:hypothetical protein
LEEVRNTDARGGTCESSTTRVCGATLRCDAWDTELLGSANEACYAVGVVEAGRRECRNTLSERVASVAGGTAFRSGAASARVYDTALVAITYETWTAVLVVFTANTKICLTLAEGIADETTGAVSVGVAVNVKVRHTDAKVVATKSWEFTRAVCSGEAVYANIRDTDAAFGAYEAGITLSVVLADEVVDDTDACSSAGRPGRAVKRTFAVNTIRHT